MDEYTRRLKEDVDRLTAERDRLRAVVDAAQRWRDAALDEHVLRTLGTDDLIALVGVLRQDCRDAFAENDRLRAAVDEREAMVVAKVHERQNEWGKAVTEAFTRAAELDGSEDMGGQA